MGSALNFKRGRRGRAPLTLNGVVGAAPLTLNGVVGAAPLSE